MNDKVFVKESYKILNGTALFKDGSVDEVKNVQVYSKINVDPWVEELKNEIERLKGELKQSATNCNKLSYALARLRWEHALNMETMIDQLCTVRPSSWRFYYKSKTYWFDRCQELKKLKEGK